VDSPPHPPPSRWPKAREILAGLGVILSLAFVGFEVRQNTLAVRGQTRDALARAGEDWLMAIAADSALSEALKKIERDQPLTSSDSARAELVMIALTRHHENVFLQVAGGTVDESVLLSYGWKRSGLYATSYYTSLWPDIRRIFSPEFVAAHEEAFPSLKSQ
jgi:hypothetical protein